MSAARLIAMPSRVATLAIPRSMATRCISSTARVDRSPVEATKDTLKKADRTVSDAAVKGINKGEQAKDKIKEAVGSTTHEAKDKAQHLKGEAAGYASEGKGKAAEAAGEAKGKTKEAMGEAAGKAKEAKQSHLG
ncbi:hypothetical protein N7512_009267 [Penicillium capsulatum]|nr:hypothetical protein N7512_009267 [Penicillium capsulatum]